MKKQIFKLKLKINQSLSPLPSLGIFSNYSNFTRLKRSSSPHLKCLNEITQVSDFLPGIPKKSRLQVDTFLLNEGHQFLERDLQEGHLIFHFSLQTSNTLRSN